MMKVGFIGWRGMVGSVLMQRMMAEGDFANIIPSFFTTSSVGKPGPDLDGQNSGMLIDAFDIDELSCMDAIVSCQGGDYTAEVHPKLRQNGWDGYWIDAASTLRMKPDSIIVLDPVNRKVIDQGSKDDIKDYIGGNCTVSLMLMALGPLFENDWIEWISAMTYQAASGSGAQNMRELISGMGQLYGATEELLDDPASAILEIDRLIAETQRSEAFPIQHFGAPLAGSLIPWIDSPVEGGQTKEEWKGMVETNKILSRMDQDEVPIDGTCVRIGAMRCHSQALTIKLKKSVDLGEIEAALKNSHEWLNFVPNDKERTLAELTPVAVTGSLTVALGRLRKLKLGDEYLSCFTVGDQLLWGAAEPLRRMLKILGEQKS